MVGLVARGSCFLNTETLNCENSETFNSIEIAIMIQASKLNSLVTPYTTFVVFREASGGVFAVEESAIEQGVHIVSPYENGTVLNHELANCSKMIGADYLSYAIQDEDPYIPEDFVKAWLSEATMMSNGHFIYTKAMWRDLVQWNATELGYASWLTLMLNKTYCTEKVNCPYFWNIKFRQEMRGLCIVIQDAIKASLESQGIPLHSDSNAVARTINGFTCEGFCPVDESEPDNTIPMPTPPQEKFIFNGEITLDVTLEVRADNRADAHRTARETSLCLSTGQASSALAWKFSDTTTQFVRQFSEQVSLAS